MWLHRTNADTKTSRSNYASGLLILSFVLPSPLIYTRLFRVDNSWLVPLQVRGKQPRFWSQLFSLYRKHKRKASVVWSFVRRENSPSRLRESVQNWLEIGAFAFTLSARPKRQRNSTALKVHENTVRAYQSLNSWLINSAVFSDILVTTPNRVCFLLKQDPPALSLEK